MNLFSTLISNSALLLTDLNLQAAGLHLGWALVLAALSAYLLRHFSKFMRFGGILLTLLACCLPTVWSPSWWLGLAYQTPSLTLQGIAFLYLFRIWQMRHANPMQTHRSTTDIGWPNSLLALGALMGWALALDSFALFDLQLYALGFSHASVFIGLMLSALLWLVSQHSHHEALKQRHRDLAVILLFCMAVMVMTGLPNGNLWNVLIDPWLWLLAQALLLQRGMVFVVLRLRLRFRSFAEEWFATI